MTSIFDLDLMEGQEGHDNEATSAIDINQQVKDLASRFHAINKDNSDKDPDWQGLLLNAKNQTEKMNIRAAKDAWLDEQKIRVFEQQQAAVDAKVNGFLNTPLIQRNKAFYDALQKNEPNSYWDSRIQRQKQRDRQVMGLSFHLKG